METVNHIAMVSGCCWQTWEACNFLERVVSNPILDNNGHSDQGDLPKDPGCHAYIDKFACMCVST